LTDPSSPELDLCRELALLPGSVFEFTSRFMPDLELEPLLPIYALREAIGNIPHSHTDDSVKWAKLKWWSEELMASEPGSSSRHPVLRALWISGARERLSDALLLRLVSDALSQIDTPPDSDEAAMFDRLGELGGTEIRLELALSGVETDPQCLKLLGAATACFRYLSSFSAKHLSATANLPLNVLAKFNVSASRLEQGANTTELSQIIAQLAENSLDWYANGLAAFGSDAESSATKHLRLRLEMERRRLESIRRQVPAFLELGTRFGPTDAWFAWRFVRKAG